MKKSFQIDNFSKKNLTLTPSKTTDFVLGFLGGIVAVLGQLLLGSDSIGLAIMFVILALILSRGSGFKYIFYGVFWLALIAGLYLGIWVFIALNMGF